MTMVGDDAPALRAAQAAPSLPPALLAQASLDALYEEPTRFRFFQAVRLLYHAGGQDGSRLGQADPVRFAAHESLSFPPGEIQNLEPATDDGRPPRMTVNFFGLTGPSGVLPHSYTRWLIERARKRDHAPREFFDIFNHRLLLLFWHAWRKHRPDVSLEFDHSRGLPRHVFDLVGMGTPALFRQLHEERGDEAGGARLPAAALAYYSGLIAQRPRGLGSISQVVGDVVGAPVAGHGCFGNWQPISSRDRTRLGRSAHALGDGCVLGARYWDRQTTVQLVIGPLDRRQFERLLPGGPLLPGLVEVIRLLTGLALDLRIKLALRADQLPPLAIAARGAHGARLGWNTWLGGRTSPQPADEVQFHFHAIGGETWP